MACMASFGRIWCSGNRLVGSWLRRSSPAYSESSVALWVSPRACSGMVGRYLRLGVFCHHTPLMAWTLLVAMANLRAW